MEREKPLCAPCGDHAVQQRCAIITEAHAFDSGRTRSASLINCGARTKTTELRSCGLKIAVVICTYRRPASLALALESIAQADRPRSAQWQVLVVDNADCDMTRQVVDDFRDRLPIRCLVEPQAGQSRARNAAVPQLDCDYFLWTDDDVTVSRHWLRSYETAFVAHPDAAFFGGPITPCFEGKPPAWLIPALSLIYSTFAGLDWTAKLEGGRLNLKCLPYGANMAVRAREQRMLTYDVNFGRQPGRWLISGEETRLLSQICRAGGFGVWVADAGVTHWINAERQSIAYLRRYFEGRAIVKARNELARQPKKEGRMAPLWVDLGLSELTYLSGRLFRRPELWVKALKEASRLRARLAARRELQREGSLGLKRPT